MLYYKAGPHSHVTVDSFWSVTNLPKSSASPVRKFASVKCFKQRSEAVIQFLLILPLILREKQTGKWSLIERFETKQLDIFPG